MLRHILLILSLLILPSAVQAQADKEDAPVILVSFDGFHPSYLKRGVTPNLSRLAQQGVTAPMRPSFPSKTFPNHWTLVTGLVPDHSGLVGNRFEDPRRPGVIFTMADDDPFWWNESEPIWAAAEKAGIRTATMFWPGSNVAWGGTLPAPRAMAEGGVRPQDWLQFNQAISNRQRINTVLDWLRRPAQIRPRLITLYFDLVDTAGHDFGPDDARMAGVIADADLLLGELVAGFRELGITPNLIVVSDHGMAATSSERVIRLDQLADPALYRVVEAGPYAALEPTPGNAERLWSALALPGTHHRCWRRGEVPERLRYGSNPRTPSIMCLADPGWLLEAGPPKQAYSGGAHGYDPAAPEMAALFIASGPAFAKGKQLPAFDNVDIAPLLRNLLKLPAADRSDGTAATFKGVIRQ